MPAYEITGVANFSSIDQALAKLERDGQRIAASLGRIQAKIGAPDTSALDATIAKESNKVIKVKAQVDQSSISAGFGNFLNSEKGKFANVGKDLGQTLQTGMTAQFGMMGSMAGSVAAALGPVGIAGLAAAAGITALGMASIGAASNWEAGMARISKTTGIDAGTAAYATLNNELKNLLTTTPTTVTEIQAVATAAGSLGIAKEDIAGFTKISLQMGSAFDVPAEEAASSISKIRSQMKTLPEEAKTASGFATHMGSAIDVMGNNYNATEAQILEFSTRVGGSLSTLGAGTYDVAGWGGMLTSVFPSAERAAGSFDSLLTNLTTNTEAQSKASEMLGISTEDFMQSMQTDPSETIFKLSDAMAQSNNQLADAKALGGTYGMDTLVKMTGHTDDYRKALREANEAGKAGTSIQGSYGRSVENMQAQMGMLTNSLTAIAIDIGTPMVSALTPAISGITSGLNTIRGAGEAVFGAITSTSAFQQLTNLGTTISSGFSGIAGSLSGTFGQIGTSLNNIFGGDALGSITNALLMPLSMSLQAVNALVSAWFTVQGAIVSVGGSIATGFLSNVEKVVDLLKTAKAYLQAFGEVTGISKAFDGVKDKVNDIIETVSDIGTKISSGLTSAIPTAVSGLQGALSSLAGQFASLITSSLAGGLSEVAGALGLGDVSAKLAAISARAKDIYEKDTQTGVAEGAKKGFEDSKGAAKDVGKTAGEAWADTFAEKLKANVSPQIAALTTSGVSEENALAIISGQTRGRKSKSTTSYDVLGTSMSVTRESADTGYFESFYMNGKMVGKEVFNLYNKLGKESSNDIGNAYYKSFKSSIRDSGAFMEDHYTKIASSVGDILAGGVLEPLEEEQLKAYKSILETFQQEIPLSFSADDSKLLNNIDDIIKGKKFSLDVQANVVPVYENWQSLAYQEKYKYENKDFFSKLTGSESAQYIGSRAELQKIADNTSGEYTKQQVATAKDGITAMDNVKTAVSDGTASSQGLFTTSISVLQSIYGATWNPPWVDRLTSAITTAIAENKLSGEAQGSYYSYVGTSGASATSNYGSAAALPTSLMSADTASWIDKLVYTIPHYQKGGKTRTDGIAYIHADEYVIPASALAESKYYSQSYWGQDELDSHLKITQPVSAFQSSAKSGLVPITGNGMQDAINPWTDESLINSDYIKALQAKWSGNSLVKPSAGVANPAVVDYAGQLAESQMKAAIATDKYAAVTDLNLKAALVASDAIILKTAADGKYCEAVSDFAIAQEEATGLFYDSFIGPTKYYNQATSQGILSTRGNASSTLASEVVKVKDAETEEYLQSIGADISTIRGDTSAMKKATEDVGSLGDKTQVYDEGVAAQIVQVTQSMIDQARENEDEYAQITMGLQPFTYGLAQFSAENGKFCTAISDFGLAQEYSGNFYASMVGVSSDAYNQMKEAESQYGKNSAQVVALGQKLGIVPTEGWGPNAATAEETKSYAMIGGQKIELSDATVAKLNAGNPETWAEIRKVAKGVSGVDNSIQDLSISVMDANGNLLQVFGAASGGSGALNASGTFGGSYGSAYSGWYTGGAAGLSSYLGTSSSSSWMNAAATSIGGSGAIQWAKGGLVNTPTFFQDAQGQLNAVGETFEPELILPLNDRKRTMELLQQHIPMARRFANGGLINGGNISAAFGSTNLGGITVINHANQPVDEKRLAKEIMAQMAEKTYQAHKRANI
ncbi:MAG: phage tail tape measure protein [Dehalococcoidia bacterium]|jgi:TP901 family phage tail tape measure protein